MKKITALALAALMLFAVGCGGSAAPAQSAAPAESAQQAATEAPTEAPTPEPTAAPAAAWETVETGAETRDDSIGNTYVRVWATIRNTGDVPLYLSSCDVDIEDESGKLLQTVKSVTPFPQVLMPGEIGAYEEQTFAAEGLPSEGLSLYFRPQAVEAKVDCVRLEVRDPEAFDERYMGVKVRGRVFNTTSEPQKLVYAAVLCFDASEHYLGTTWTILSDELPADERQGIETMGSDWFSAADVASMVAYAYPMQYQF